MQNNNWTVDKSKKFKELISNPIFQEVLEILKETTCLKSLTYEHINAKDLKENGEIFFATDLGRAKTIAQLESFANEPEENINLNPQPTYAHS